MMNGFHEMEAREEELHDLCVAFARAVTDTGVRTPLDEAAAKLGVDLDSLRQLDDDTGISRAGYRNRAAQRLSAGR